MSGLLTCRPHSRPRGPESTGQPGPCACGAALWALPSWGPLWAPFATGPALPAGNSPLAAAQAGVRLRKGTGKSSRPSCPTGLPPHTPGRVALPFLQEVPCGGRSLGFG